MFGYTIKHKLAGILKGYAEIVFANKYAVLKLLLMGKSVNNFGNWFVILVIFLAEIPRINLFQLLKREYLQVFLV